MANIDISNPGAAESTLNAAIQSLILPTPSGASLTLSSDLTAQNYAAGATIAFNSTVYDTDSWISGSTFVVPSGVTRVGVEGTIYVNSTTAGQNGALGILKNGTGIWASNTSPYATSYQITTTNAYSTWTYYHPVSAGNTFALWFASGGDTSLNVEAVWSFFRIWDMS